MRLNPRCPELRGAENRNQARYHCPFAVPIRRSNIPGHRGFGMERLGRNIKFSFFSESWGVATEKALSPILELTLGTTS